MKKLIIFLIAAAIFLSGCSAKSSENTQSVEEIFYAMDTVMIFHIYGPDAEAAMESCREEVLRLDRMLSALDPDSELSALNGSQGVDISVSDEMIQFTNCALELSARTNGLFDPTLLHLKAAWGFYDNQLRLPSEEDICVLLEESGPEHIIVKASTIAVTRGCGLDFGGIAKGIASDSLFRILESYEITGALLSLGGNVCAYGVREDGAPWNIGIENPNAPGRWVAVLSLSNGFAVTSGGYMRYLTAEDGTQYSHILDPRTGAPVKTDILAVTVVCEDGAVADAYSTALYIMGYEDAIAFWRENPKQFEAIFVLENGEIAATEGLKDCLMSSSANHRIFFEEI